MARKHGTGTLYRKRGRGCWRVKWMYQGKLFDQSTNTEDYEKALKIAQQRTACFSALGDVRTLSAQLEKARDEQKILEAKTNPSLTLYRLIDGFKSCDVVRRRNCAQVTKRRWVSYGNLLIDYFGGKTEMRQLTREMVERFMRDYEEKVSPVQFNAALRFYKRVWDALKKYDSTSELKARLHGDSPWNFILPMKKGEVVGKKPFTREQLKRIWRVLEKIGDDELTLLFDLARNTGARLHDLVSWKWDEHLRFITRSGDNGELKVEAVLEWKPLKTKNSTGKIITIPILDERVVGVLHRRWIQRTNAKEDNQWILPRMLELYNKDNAKALTKLCQSIFIKAGIETKVKVEGNSRANCVYGMHSFRHTLVSELFKNGVDLGTIQHLYTGHGSAYVTELYAHADIDKKRFDLSKLEKIDVEQEKVPSWFVDLSNVDKEAYDEIVNMDIKPELKTHLKGLIRVKDVSDLKMISTWISKRIKQLCEVVEYH